MQIFFPHLSYLMPKGRVELALPGVPILQPLKGMSQFVPRAQGPCMSPFRVEVTKLWRARSTSQPTNGFCFPDCSS